MQFKPATMVTNGYIQFSLQGSSESKGGIMNATKDENSVMFRKSQAEEFEAIKDYVESYIAGRLSPVVAQQGAPTLPTRFGNRRSSVTSVS